MANPIGCAKDSDVKNLLAIIFALPLLVACASLDELKRVEPQGSAYSIALANHYKDFSQSEAEQYDWADSQYFAEKGLRAAYNQEIIPEETENWDLPATLAPTLADAREQLVAALTPEIQSEKPEIAAQAVFNFDCWVEQQEENWQGADIAACRDDFYDALDKLTAQPETAVTPVVEKNGFTPTENPDEQISTSYVIFFDINSTAITKDGESVIGDVYNELSDDTEYNIRLDGHADRSGKDKYNKVLSERRAIAVRERLKKKGLTKGNFTITAHGETIPLIETPDGAKEKANRRVEIFINE